MAHMVPDAVKFLINSGIQYTPLSVVLTVYLSF